MTRLALILTLLLGTAALADEPLGDLPPDAGTEEAYRIGPKDTIRIDVYGEKDLSGQWTLREDGRIEYPYLGAVEVGGLRPQDVSQLIAERLAEGYLVSPQVSVQVTEHRSQRVQVFGAVKTTGTVYLQGPTTLLDVLADAGRVDEERSNREVHVTRDGTTWRFNLDALYTQGEGNIYVRDGDIVRIPEGQFVYVAGEVAKPGAVLFQEGLTVIQALTKVGGPSQTAMLRGAYILRDGERIPVNLKRILDGKEADVSLEPGDQLFLKESPI